MLVLALIMMPFGVSSSLSEVSIARSSQEERRCGGNFRLFVGMKEMGEKEKYFCLKHIQNNVLNKVVKHI